MSRAHDVISSMLNCPGVVSKSIMLLTHHAYQAKKDTEASSTNAKSSADAQDYEQGICCPLEVVSVISSTTSSVSKAFSIRRLAKRQS